MRRLPPLHSLRAFEAAARHLHFGHAAAELHVDATAISHQIRKLEELLGTPLLQRRPRPLRLTEAGALLFPVLRDAMDRMAAASEQVRHPKPTTIAVSMTMAFAAEWFMPRLAGLKADIGHDIALHADNHPVDLHAAGIDLAIRSQEHPDAHGVWQHLFDDRLVAVATPDVLARCDDPRLPANLKNAPLIRYDWTSERRATSGWERWFAEAGIKTGKLSFEAAFSEESHAIQAACAGLGVALLSECLVAARIANGQLLRVCDHHLPLPPFWAVRLTTHRWASEIDLLVERMRTNAPTPSHNDQKS